MDITRTMVQEESEEEGCVASMRACRFVPLPEIRTVRRVLGGDVMVEGWRRRGSCGGAIGGILDERKRVGPRSSSSPGVF